MNRLIVSSLNKKIVLLVGAGLGWSGILTSQTPSLPTATSTSLTLSSAALESGTTVVVTAKVTASGTPITVGAVTFCDATATYCEGPAVLGSAQLSASGVATLKHIFGPGDRSIKAVFEGIHGVLASTSTSVSLIVSGVAPTTTVVASSGRAGNYTLTGTVGYHGLASPLGSEIVNFVDTGNRNLLLGATDISAATIPSYDFITIPTSPVAAGSIPASIVTGDFNDDGVPDFAVANLKDSTISVFLGDGTGVFSQMAGSPFAVGGGPAALVIADVNADGLPDILSANSVGNSVSILFGRSGGGFTVGPRIAVGSNPESIVIGDFNGDGFPDIAVANLYDSTITVLLNDGAGGYAANPSATYSVGQNPSWLVVGDFNADGALDLAAVDTTSNTLTLLQGDGLGGFTPAPGSPLATIAYPVSAVVGDFNGDGKADLAVLSGTSNLLSILMNTGTGFTAIGSPYTTGASPSAVMVSDFNGDGKQDLMVTNGNANTATIFFGDGTGAFSIAPNSVLSELNAPASLATADFDGDGTPDVAITNVGGGTTSIRPLQISRFATATLPEVVVPGAAVPHAVAATYAGDSLYLASTSSTILLTGSPIATKETLAVSPAASVAYGQVVQLTAAIAPPSASNYTATGAVKFFDAGALIGQSNVTNGQALLSLNSLVVAPHTLTAEYQGDANFVAGKSPAAALDVSKASVRLSLTDIAGSGGGFTFTATVTSATSGVPTGTVGFYEGSNLIGSSSLTAGVATYSTTSLPAGVHSITATYSGDSHYAGGTSAALPTSSGDFSLSAVQPSTTVLPGGSITYALTLTPEASFPNTISFAVTGLPSGATASFSPSTLSPGTAAASTAMTVTVPAEVAALHRSHSGAGIVFALLLIPFAGLRRFGKAATWRFHALGITVIALVSFAAAVTLTGCGNNGYLAQASRNYTLTVTASSGAITHSTSLQLNVQ